MTTRIIAGDILTGRVRIAAIPARAADVTQDLGLGRLSAAVQLPATDPLTGNKLDVRGLIVPGKSFIGYVQNGKIVEAGPVWSDDTSEQGLHTMQGLNMRSLLDHAWLLDPLILGEILTDKSLTFDGIHIRTQAKRIIQEYLKWNPTLPIVLEDDIAGITTRTYTGLTPIRMGDAMDNLEQVLGGPEIRLKPRFKAGTSQLYVEWVQQTGTPELTQPGADHIWNIGLPGSGAKGPSAKRDASMLVSDMFATGSARVLPVEARNVLPNPSGARSLVGINAAGGVLSMDSYTKVTASGASAVGASNINLATLTVGTDLAANTDYTLVMRLSSYIAAGGTPPNVVAGLAGAGLVAASTPSFAVATNGETVALVRVTTAAAGVVTVGISNGTALVAGDWVGYRQALLIKTSEVISYFDGSQSLVRVSDSKYTAAGAVAIGAASIALGPLLTVGTDLLANTDYTVYAKINDTGPKVKFQAAGTGVVTTPQGPAAFDATPGGLETSFTFRTGAAATTLQIAMSNADAMTVGQTFGFTDFSIQQTSAQILYFDGESSTTGFDYAWAGVKDASVSTRAPHPAVDTPMSSWSHDPYLASRGFVSMHDLEQYDTVSDQATLDGYTAQGTDLGKYMMETWQVTFRKGTTPALDEYDSGDWATFNIQAGHPWAAPGKYRVRLMSITASLGPWVSALCAPERILV